MADKTIKIAYLYEDLMNTYGDSGDVKVIRYLLDKQGYQTEVDNISLDDSFDANDYDFLFFGGGQDFEQTVVAKICHVIKKQLKTISKPVIQCFVSVVVIN